LNAEPDYVNEPLEAEWYDGDIPDECRCQYEFQHSHEYDGRDVHGRPCGLLVIGDLKYQRADNCYFHSLRDREDDQHLEPLLERAVRSRPYLGEAHLWNAHLEGAYLVGAHLQGAYLFEAHLESAYLWGAHLQGTHLMAAHLEGADLLAARLERAHLREAHLAGANLRLAHLDGADLTAAHMEGTNLRSAHLEGTDLWAAHLEGAILLEAHLEGADLRVRSLRNADLRSTTIGSLQQFSPDTNSITTRITHLSDADLAGALLAGARIEPQADLSGARIDCPLLDERCARSDRGWDEARDSRSLADYWRQPTLRDCEAVYRHLKLNFQESGDYPEASKFFIREMECKRARMLRDPDTQPAFWGRAGALLLLIPVLAALLFRALAGKPPDHRVWLPWALCALLCFALWAWPARHRAPALGLTLWYWLCGYGEQPLKIAIWIAVVIAVSTALYAHFGIADPNQPGAYKVNPGAAWLWGPNVNAWATSFYFSVITATTCASRAPSMQANGCSPNSPPYALIARSGTFV